MSQVAAAVVAESPESGSGVPMLVRHSRIVRFEGQPRRYFDPKSLLSLSESIQYSPDGQETPVKICKNSKMPGYFTLVDGERRWRAFGLIRDRTGTDPLVKCFIDAVHDERHHFRKAFISNLEREDLIPLDEAAAYQRFYDESGAGSHRAKVVEIATLVKKSGSHIENYLAVHTLPEAVKLLMDPERTKEERLSITSAVDIAKSTSDKALQITLAQEAVERSLGTAEMRTLISVRTGKSAYGISGRLRKPSDDYKVLKGFLGRTSTTAKRLLNALDIDDLYASRDDEFGDREFDAAVIEETILDLKDLLKKIEKGVEKNKK